LRFGTGFLFDSLLVAFLVSVLSYAGKSGFRVRRWDFNNFARWFWTLCCSGVRFLGRKFWIEGDQEFSRILGPNWSWILLCATTAAWLILHEVAVEKIWCQHSPPAKNGRRFSALFCIHLNSGNPSCSIPKQDEKIFSF